jgi:hypothetical protein
MARLTAPMHSDIDWDDLADFVGLQHNRELGDTLAVALALQPASSTFHMSGRRRRLWERLWLSLLPGKRCRYCASRIYRTDPDGQPSRVWWCREHGPFEQPELLGWKVESRITRTSRRPPPWAARRDACQARNRQRSEQNRRAAG